MVSGAIWASILDAFAGQRHQNERQRSEQNMSKNDTFFWGGIWGSDALACQLRQSEDCAVEGLARV